MKVLGLVIACVALMNCGKGTESVPTDDKTPPAVPDAGSAESIQPIGCLDGKECPAGAVCDTKNFCDAPPGCTGSQACPAVCYGRCVVDHGSPRE